MSEEAMENIWATQYRCFAETVLAELHHKYDLRLRVTPVQKSTTKVTDKAQKVHRLDVDRASAEHTNKEVPLQNPSSFNFPMS